VISIGDYAFSGCTVLARVTMGINVASIGEGAFKSCKNLLTITIPESVRRIGASAFSGCSSLIGVTVEAPEGWIILRYPSNITVSADKLSNSSTAASFFTAQYYDRVWEKE
jgi:hypothetical protein